MKAFLKKAESKIKSIINKEESSKDDYRRIGSKYYSKKFFIFLILIIIIIPVIAYKFILPQFEGKYWEAKIMVNSRKLNDFTGKVQILDKNKEPIFKGLLDRGEIVGVGEIFYKKKLVYKGEFEKNKYSGNGEKYSLSGKLIYKGSFLENYYEGEGKLFLENGIVYEGEFKNGHINGIGSMSKDGHLIYQGQFKSDKYDGFGTLYDLDGFKVYEGNFVQGYFEGSGKLYENQELIYEGELKGSKLNGSGILYDKLGFPLYKGIFKDDNIDFNSILSADIDSIRNMFGVEDEYLLYEDFFITKYPKLSLSFQFNYIDDTNNSITLNKIIYYGERPFDGIFVGDIKSNYDILENYKNVDFMLISSALDFEYEYFLIQGNSGVYGAIARDNQIKGIIIKKVN